jgi:hypothetical protein
MSRRRDESQRGWNMSNAIALALVGAAVAAPTLLTSAGIAKDPLGAFAGAEASGEVSGNVGGGVGGAVGKLWDFFSPGGLQGVGEGGEYAWDKASDGVKSAIKDNLFTVVAVVVVGFVGWKIYKGASGALVPG